MNPTRVPPKPDPHERLRQMKVAALSTTGAILATISWLVVGHAVGSTTPATQPPHAIVSAHTDDDDGNDFFGGGAALSNGVFQQPVMRSSGS